ncbi:MAG: hypothetical protein V1743_07705 [Nanoarchaeota archaeon]
MGKHDVSYLLVAIIIVSAAFLIACTPTTPKPGQGGNETLITGNSIDESLIDINEPKTTPSENGQATAPEEKKTASGEAQKKDDLKGVEIPAKYANINIKKYAVEGEVITLAPEAYDPDGDKVVYTFSKPFDRYGKWETKEGDAGFYPVTVTASDGTLNSSQEVLIVVKPSNKAPILNCPAEITAQEGETITLDCTAEDKEGDQIIWEYSGWMTQKTKETTFDSAGNYKTHVKVSDGNKASERDITITVKNVNRAPVLEELEPITVTEADTVRMKPAAKDPDQDAVTFTFGAPLDKDGVWKTKKGDKGTYDIAVTASDGTLTDMKKVSITVQKLNTAPVLKQIQPITVNEGETIKLTIDATDPENDKVIITVSGWMDSDEYTTTYDDAGTHTVIVTASDGFLETSQNVTVNVINSNRPPVFRIPV